MFLTGVVPQTRLFDTSNSTREPASLVRGAAARSFAALTRRAASGRNEQESLRAHLEGLAEGQRRDAFNLLVLTSWEPQPSRHAVNFITCLFPFRHDDGGGEGC